MTDFSEILDSIPEWDRFLTVDEQNRNSKKLAEEYPKKVKLLELGESTLGETIYCLKIGSGKYNALIHGFPNSEEPYGGNLLDYLSTALAKNDEITKALDYTWYLIKCSDPDAARRNEGFQKGPITPLNFSLNYYRTPIRLAPEFCFPFRYGPLDLNNPPPETRAMMTVIDKVKIHFLSSLHMMKWGGINFMVPHPCTDLYADLQNAAKRFNVFTRKRPGTTIAPGIVQLRATPARDWVRHYAAGNRNIEPLKGCFLYEYAQVLNPNAFIMIPECCIWYDPRMLDDRESDSTFGDSLKYANDVTKEANNFLLETWNQALPHLNTETPYKKMVKEYMDSFTIRMYTIVSNPPSKFDSKVHARKLSVAEKIGVEGHDDIYRMFDLCGSYRMLDEEYKVTGNDVVGVVRDKVHTKLLEYDRFLYENYDVVSMPIKNLVGMSIESLLHSSQYTKTLQR